GIDEATPEVTQADPDQSETSDSAAPSTPASGSAELPDLSALNDLDDTGEDPSDDDLSALMSTMSGQTAEPEPQDEDTSADASDDDLSALMGATQGVDDAPAYHTVLEAETAVADSDNPTEENTPDNMADLIETGSDQQKIEAETTIDAGAVLSEATDGVIEEENPDHANPQDETLENPTETFETPSTPITGFESEAVVADAEPALDPASEVEASSDPAGQTKTLSHRAAPETEAPADQIASIDDLDAQSGQHDTDDDGSDDLAALLSSFSDQGNSPLSVGETPEVETSPSKDHVAEQTDDQTLSQAEQSTDVVGPEEDHDPASAQPSETANGGNLESLSDMFSQMDPSTGDSAEDSAEFVTGSDEKQDADDDGLGGLIALHDALPDQKALEETSDFTKPEDIPSSVESATDQNETKIGTDEVTENDQPIEEFGNEVAASPDPAQSALDAPDVPSIDPEETSETVAEEPDYSEFEALMAGQPQETEMPLAASGHETDHVAEPISPPATDDGPKVVVDADSLPVQTAEAAPEMIPEQTAQPAHASTTDAAPDYSEFEALMAATAVDDVSGAESMAETYLPEPGIQDSDDAEVVTDPPQPPAEEPPLTPSSEPEMSPEIVAEPVSAPVPPPTTEPAGTRSERKKKATLDDLYQFFPK
uniref:hypothetical protein n=1 Tax=Thalassovita sp. TaxID=1979401 RepID=UPI002B266D18